MKFHFEKFDITCLNKNMFASSDSLKQFNKIINDNRNDENFAKLNKSH